MSSSGSPAGDSSNSPARNHPAPPPPPPQRRGSSESRELSPDEWLRRKQHGNELAATLRRLADREENPSYKAHLYSCINAILIDAARNPVRDRARVMKAMREWGGGLPSHIAKEAKLPKTDVQRILDTLVEEKLAYRSREGGLYFLTDDPSAPAR